MKFQDSLIGYVQYTLLKCYGHIKRMGGERLPKRVLLWFPPVDEQKVDWMNHVQKTLQAKGIVDQNWEEKLEHK